jgi:hypothetical protein
MNLFRCMCICMYLCVYIHKPCFCYHSCFTTLFVYRPWGSRIGQSCLYWALLYIVCIATVCMCSVLQHDVYTLETWRSAIILRPVVVHFLAVDTIKWFACMMPLESKLVRPADLCDCRWWQILCSKCILGNNWKKDIKKNIWTYKG